MNDNKTLKDIIIEETEQELASNLPEFSASPEEMLAKAKAKEKKAKRRRLGYFVFAAVLLLAFVAIGMKCSDTFLTVDADKNGKEEIVTDDGVIIEDEGWGSSETDYFETTDWNDIVLIKAQVPQLRIPKELPEGYNFRKMSIETFEKGFTCTFTFFKKEKIVEIREHLVDENLQSMEVDYIGKIIESKDGKVYIRENEKLKIATIRYDDGLVVELNSDLEERQVVKIIENMN